MSMIYILHENQKWIQRITTALDALGLPYADWFLNTGTLRFSSRPPEGIFYNRMSASSHFREHKFAVDFTHAHLNWLNRYQRRVINGRRALYLEISKAAQYAEIEKLGLQVPRTDIAVGKDQLLAAARTFGPGQFLIKPNRGGSGNQIELINHPEEVEKYISDQDYQEPLDGTWLLQEYIKPANGYVMRCEFVGGKFLYAVQVDPSQGFDLCPDKECREDGNVGTLPTSEANEFTIIPDFEHEIIGKYEFLLQKNDIEIGAVEFVESGSGEIFTYDVNTNTNYNADAEAEANVSLTGPEAIARFLGKELKNLQKR